MENEVLNLNDRVYLLQQIVNMHGQIERTAGAPPHLRSLVDQLIERYIKETAQPLCPNCNWPQVDKVAGTAKGAQHDH